MIVAGIPAGMLDFYSISFRWALLCNDHRLMAVIPIGIGNTENHMMRPVQELHPAGDERREDEQREQRIAGAEGHVGAC